jgi:hypothetical protein
MQTKSGLVLLATLKAVHAITGPRISFFRLHLRRLDEAAYQTCSAALLDASRQSNNGELANKIVAIPPKSATRNKY